jgi:pyruvate kinase
VRRKTKIIATLGPAIDSASAIRELIEQGMNVARLNFSHGTKEDHRKRCEWVRAEAADLGMPIAVMQDIQGPRIRVGTFSAGAATLEPDAEVTLIAGEGEGDESRIFIAYLESVRLEPGHPIVLADGLISLEVVAVGEGEATARVIGGGELLDQKGVAFPASLSEVPVITSKDEEDLLFGRELGVDLVAASFVQRGQDLRDVRKHAGKVPVIAKIESAIGYSNLDDILEEADGAMVARGDLGVELSLQSVPRAQREILALTNAAAKISITATEMLESMTSSPRPTGAEVTDVYRSVLDGTDAVMLSAETAIGLYPAAAVRAMDIICREAEQSSDYGRAPEVSQLDDRSRFASATAEASVDTADRLDLHTIVAFTESGSTARLLSKYRPRADIYAFTALPTTYRAMSIYGGVTPLMFEREDSTDEMISRAEQHLLAEGIVDPGEGLVMVAGIPPNQRASTNIMKLHEVGSTVTGVPGGV